MMINKARMTQAKTVLGHLTKTEAIYFSDHDRYTDNVVLLDFDPVKYPYYNVLYSSTTMREIIWDRNGVGPMAGTGGPSQRRGFRPGDNSVFR